MFTGIEQYITQMKLRELRKQRDSLLGSYRALRQHAHNERDDGRKLRFLYEGLRQIKFADQPLHPEVANLGPVLHELDNHSHASVETVAFWRDRLEKELDRGEMRSEIVYVFGALLEEWAVADANAGPLNAESRVIHARLIEAASQVVPDEMPKYAALLDDLFEGWSVTGDETAAPIHRTMQKTLRERIEPDDIDAALRQISEDVYRSDATREQAKNVLLNPVLCKEFADALSIMLDGIGDWAWPESGVRTSVYWTPNKWRLFLDDDLPTACLLDVLGRRWRSALDLLFRHDLDMRLQRIRRLISTRAPSESLEREVRRFGQAIGLDSADEKELWAGREALQHGDEAPVSVSHLEELRRGGMPDSILEQRHTFKEQMRSLKEQDKYGAKGYTGGPELCLTLVNAEIALQRAAFPNQPVYVIKADFKDYYPSLPHDLLLDILARLGLTQSQLQFFRRYLQTPLQRPGDDGRPVTAQCGVPNNRRLSDVLGELILSLLDTFVRRAARVRVLRLGDDVCVLASSAEDAVRAWQAIRTFADACGLTLNEDKCGAVCIGGELPGALPSTPPTWLFFALDRHGEWHLHAPTFDAYLEQTRQQVRQAGSIVSQVQVYNAGMSYLQKALAMRVALGESHRRGVSAAMHRFHHQFSAETQGIVDLLRRSIRDRFLERDATTRLPEAWLYWPLTAGGLGLTQSSVLTASFAESYKRRSAPVPPEGRGDDWQRRYNDWARFYGGLLEHIEPHEPTRSQVMETLVRDFINRGAEISDGKQTTLSVYWRWILYIYGPQILDEFGTFRFLIAELVPLQLINQKYGRAGVDDADGGATGAIKLDDIPF